MNDWESRLRVLERDVLLIREQSLDVAVKAERAQARIINPPVRIIPPGSIDCTYNAWPTTLNWEFTGSYPSTPLPIGVSTSRTVGKVADLNSHFTLVGTPLPVPCKGWIGDPDEYPGIGNSSYRFVAFEPNFLRVGYATWGGAAHSLTMINVQTLINCTQKTITLNSPYGLSLFSATRFVSVH